MDELSENDIFPPYISLTDRANLSNIQEKLVISATVRKGSIVAYHDLHLNVRFQYKADIRVDCSEHHSLVNSSIIAGCNSLAGTIKHEAFLLSYTLYISIPIAQSQ